MDDATRFYDDKISKYTLSNNRVPVFTLSFCYYVCVVVFLNVIKRFSRLTCRMRLSHRSSV